MTLKDSSGINWGAGRCTQSKCVLTAAFEVGPRQTMGEMRDGAEQRTRSQKRDRGGYQKLIPPPRYFRSKPTSERTTEG
jgi:hypothetical protein